MSTGTPSTDASTKSVAGAAQPSRSCAHAPTVTVVVPTYREADSLPHLIERLAAVRREHDLDLQLLIMDDNSRDGTSELIERLNLSWVRLVTRTGQRGLSPAVVEGLWLADREFVVVMDADLSHPPETIPAMLDELRRGAEFVIGSRYAAGGTTDADWGAFRWLNSKVATLLARPFTRARDPMAGFLGFRRDLLDRADPLNPVGYKIGLELIVKCRCRDVREVPIHFADRRHGESKLTLKEQLRYIQHLRRLFLYTHPNLACLLQFGLVGASGTVVNLAVLTVLYALGVPFAVATAVAIAVSMVTNFLANRRFTFSYAKHGPLLRQFAGFVAACSIGAIVNYVVAVGVYRLVDDFPLLPQVAALVGILAGMGVNFFFNRYFVFRRPPA